MLTNEQHKIAIALHSKLEDVAGDKELEFFVMGMAQDLAYALGLSDIDFEIFYTIAESGDEGHV